MSNIEFNMLYIPFLIQSTVLIFGRQIMRLNLAIMAALLPINLAFAADNPLLQDNLLTIPHIDTPEQVGQYKDARFMRNEKDGTWTYLGMAETKLATVEKVETIKIPSRPVQVFLKASGYLPNACYRLEQARQRYEPIVKIPEADLPWGRFEIALGLNPLQTLTACAQVIEPFELIIPLPVYGLSRGTYTFDVNGIGGSFQLNLDNNLPPGHKLSHKLIDISIPEIKIDDIVDSALHASDSEQP